MLRLRLRMKVILQHHFFLETMDLVNSFFIFRLRYTRGGRDRTDYLKEKKRKKKYNQLFTYFLIVDYN